MSFQKTQKYLHWISAQCNVTVCINNHIILLFDVIFTVLYLHLSVHWIHDDRNVTLFFPSADHDLWGRG